MVPPQKRPAAFASIAYPPELPIAQRRDQIVAAIRNHQTIVLTGETGSGKTTQIPKMCLDAGFGLHGKRIACTQPRRVAALSVARRVAEELEVNFGDEVGAKIRFTDQTSKRTRVKFMTDGMLLSEIQSDPLMREYEAVIIDEAHERSLNIDFLLGHLNQLRSHRPDLKIVITSATIDTEKFSAAFDNAPIIEVSGRVYPVDIVYAPLDEFLEDTGDFTYLEGIAESTQRIQEEFGLGDILAFLPTEKDIREAQDLLESRFGRRMEIIPCYGRLSNADQQRIFLPSPKRKLVLATNIAETSLTIPGIRFVIDAGLARIARYNPRGRTKRLPIVKVSQSSANQRAGRCGRVADGICIRLYSEKDYLSRPVYSTPEIQRANLADVILRMLASKLGDVESFPFIDPPSPASITAGYQLLQELGALKVRSDRRADSPAGSHSTQIGSDRRADRNAGSSPTQNPEPSLELTKTGRQLAKLPVDPTVGRMLLEAHRHGVTHEILVIASALSIQDPRERPIDQEAAAKQAHARFEHKQSDFLTLLTIWEALHDDFENLSQSRLRKFCKKHFLNYLRVREWRDTYHQLERSLPDTKSDPSPLPKGKVGSDRRADRNAGSPKTIAERSDTGAAPQRPNTPNPEPILSDSARFHAIHTCLLTGLLANVGHREDTNLYRCSANRKPLIFPGSALFIRQPRDKKTGKRKTLGTEAGPKKQKSPEWILSGELVETNRLYARTVAAIEPAWILEAGQHIVTRHYSDPQFLPNEGRVAARESIRIHGLEIQNKKVSYLKVDPEKATEIFIREALLNEAFEAPANWTFLEANRRLVSRIQNAQTVISVAHWMGVEEAAFRFYQSRLENVASIHDLNRLLKRSKVGSDRRADRNAGSSLQVGSDRRADRSAGSPATEAAPNHGADPATDSQPRTQSPVPREATQELRRSDQTPQTNDFLRMQESDLTASDDSVVDLSLFPETVELENSALPIEYQYKHGHERDGVTLKLPYHKAKSVNNALLDWLVPGHLEAKTHALLKALPKQIRQRLLPLADTAKTIATEIRPTGETLVASLQTYLKTAYSVETYNSDWDESVIPDHLRARVEVYDETGNAIAYARDSDSLQQQIAKHESELSRTQSNDTRHLWQQAREKYERPVDSLTDLRQALEATHSLPEAPSRSFHPTSNKSPAPTASKNSNPQPTGSNSRLGGEANLTSQANRILIGNPNGVPLYAYPALRANTSSPASNSPDTMSRRDAAQVSVCSIHFSLLSSPEEAQTASANGIAALLEHELRRELAWIQSDLKEVERVGPVAVAFRPMARLKEDVYEHIRQTLRTHSIDTLDIDAIRAARDAAHAKSKGLLYPVVDQLKTILEKRQSLIVQPDLAKAFGADIDRLLPPDFLRHTPNPILLRLPTYLDAIEHRHKTRAQNPARDAQRQAQLDHYRNRYAQLVSDHMTQVGSDRRADRVAGSSTQPTPSATPQVHRSPLATHHSAPSSITDLKFMIEEYAVSLFAQHLGTAYPVSPKKLDQAFAEATSATQSPPSEARIKNPEPKSQYQAKRHRSCAAATKHPAPGTQKPASKGSSDRPTQADLDSLKNLFK